MTIVLQSDHAKYCQLYHCLLAFVWLTGLFTGFLFYCRYAPLFLPLMRRIHFDSVSIVGLLFSAFIPFLISAFAVIFSRPSLLLTVCFIKAFFFTLLSSAFFNRYGDSGWLVQRLILFHELFSFPILYTFWCRFFRLHKLPSIPECLLWICLEMLIVAMAYGLLEPIIKGLERF